MKIEMQTETGTGQSVTNTFLQNSNKRKSKEIQLWMSDAKGCCWDGANKSQALTPTLVSMSQHFNWTQLGKDSHPVRLLFRHIKTKQQEMQSTICL